MADFNSTRRFHSQVSDVCQAFESLQVWVESESQKVGDVFLPMVSHLRDLLDRADAVCGPDDRS